MLKILRTGSLRTVLFLCFTLISAIPVLLLAFWVQQTALQHEYDAVHEKHLIIAKNLTGSINRYIADLKSGFRIAGTSAENGKKPLEVYRFLNELHFKHAWVLSETEAPVLFMDFTSGVHAAELSASVVDSFRDMKQAITLDPETVHISGVMPDADKQPVFVAFKQLHNQTYLAGIVSTSYLVKVQKAITFGTLGHAAIVDQVGRVIGHPLDDWIASMKDVSKIEPVRKMMAGETGVTVFYTPAMQADMIAGHTTVEETGWGVMIPQPISELETKAAALRTIVLMIAAAGMLIAVFISWWMARFITRPLKGIVSYTETVVSGDLHKYHSPEGRFMPRELRKLLVSFENMVESLIAKTTDLIETSGRLREAQKIAKLGNWEFNPSTGKMWWSDEVYSILEYPRPANPLASFVNNPAHTKEEFLAHLPAGDAQLLEKKLQLATQYREPFSIEHRVLRAEGEQTFVQQDVVTKEDPETSQGILVGTIQDISERKLHEQNLAYQAHYDSLTGLPNRNLCLDRLEHAIAKAQRAGSQVPLLLIGLDHFKEVNDAMGHLVGDQVLRMAAARLESQLRKSDTLARLGSDEFAIVIEDLTDQSDVSGIAQKIVDEFKMPFLVDDCEIVVSASIGISSYPQDDYDPLGLLQKSDTALHTAKASGRMAYTLFTPEMDAAVNQRINLRSDLATALANKELHLVFQPIVDSESGEIISSETLLRWNHPQKGAISPDVFIPIAEDSGYIGEIGFWVLDKAVEQLGEWHRAGYPNLKMSVNLSLRQIQLGLTAAQVEAVLERHHVSPDKLMLEVTESMLMENVEFVRSWMNQLRDTGVRFAIDDFGTGYCSLNYLLSLPVSVLKIDRCFISNLNKGEKDQTLVSAIVGLSHQLGYYVVAEGVEEEIELSKLREFGCDCVQGYFFSKPLSPTAFWSYLKDSNPPQLTSAA